MDKYDTSNDHYCRAGTTTLKNKLDIRDIDKLEEAERDITALMIKNISFKPSGTSNNHLFARFLRWISFSDPHVCLIHCGSQNSSALNSDENLGY